jgi:hypothetical protein
MRLAKHETKPPSPSRPAQEEVQRPKKVGDDSEKVRVDEELTSGKEVVDLSPPQALDRAERFLMGQGYVVEHRTATTLTVEREGFESPTGQEGAPKVVVMAVPQPDGGVRIKVRDDHREGAQERQGLWKLWTENLPKKRL